MAAAAIASASEDGWRRVSWRTGSEAVAPAATPRPGEDEMAYALYPLPGTIVPVSFLPAQYTVPVPVNLRRFSSRTRHKRGASACCTPR